MGRLDEALRSIETMRPASLRTMWRDQWGSEPPNLSTDLLRLGLAYRLQEKAHGSLPARIRRAIARGTGASARLARPGTRLVRSWNGSAVIVEVEAEGYRWRETLYPSLTAVARAVTGVHWSGPRFFGLVDHDRD